MSNYNIDKEIWKPVIEEGFEGFYEVSNLGRIRSTDRIVESKRGPLKYKGKLLSPSPNSDGYLTVNLCKSGKKKNVKVHQVVAKAFIPNPNNFPEVNHIDENKANNQVTNLEWCTRKHNMNHGTALERMKKHPNQKKRCEESKSPIIGINIKDGSEIRFESISEADKNGFKRRNLWSALNGYDASHKGYVWCRAEEYSPVKVKKLLDRTKVKKVAHIDDNGNVIRIFENTKEASRYIGVNPSQISRVCNGKMKQTKGYKLKYVI